MQRYSGGQDNEFWLEAWNGNSYSIERIGRQLESIICSSAWSADSNPTNW